MLIGIAGPICSGKRTIASYLLSNHNFTRLRLRQPTTTTDTANSRVNNSEIEFQSTPSTTPPPPLNELSNGVHQLAINGNEDIWFNSMTEMIDYVTKRWRDNFVTVDIWNEKDLEIAIKRPFFLLISVDAPIAVRWKRHTQRSLPSQIIVHKQKN